MKKLVFILAFGSEVIFAQTLPPPLNSPDIFEKGMNLYREKKYDEALAELEKIDRNDTNYYSALVEKAIVLLELENYEKSADACREGITLNSPETHNFYINLGVILNTAKKPEEALAALDEGLSKYPKNHLIVYNKAIVYKAMGKMQEALELFRQTILLNPYHANSHLNLALMATEEGKIAQALMSFNMYLILVPDGSSSNAVLKKMNEIVSSKYEKKPAGIILSPEGTDDFSEIDLLLTNYAALSKNYKIPVKTELPLVKQNYALFTKLQYDKKDQGFWMQTYVPFFKEIISQDMFEPFTWHILQSSGNEEHIKMVKKNSDGIRKFTAWAGPEIDKMNAIRPVMVDGSLRQLKHWYDAKSHYLKIIGNANTDNTMLVGYCENYFMNGKLSSKGYYDNNGKEEGTWVFFHKNGNKSEDVIYKSGNINGPFKVYHKNGNINREGTFTEGKQNGVQKEYNASGKLTSLTQIKDNILDGKFTIYFDLGSDYKSFDGWYKNGKINDTLIEYYDNGAVASRKFLADDITQGMVSSYFRNGDVSATEKFLNNNRDGEFIIYYPEGKLRQKGLYKNGAEIGNWISYYRNGQREEELVYDEKGKKNGSSKIFDKDGLLHYEIEYLRGEIIGYRFYDKSGKILKEDKKKKGEFDYTGFYPRGIKKLEGMYTADGKKGTWKYYDEYGNLSAQEIYNDKGQVHGKAINYYANGKIRSEGNFLDGEDDGYYVSYFRNGNKELEGWYKKGKKQGYWISYIPDGTIEAKNYYVNGKTSGFQQYFSVTGLLDHEEFIRADLTEKIVYFDSTGKITQTILLPAGNGDYNLNFHNGKTYFNGKYVAGTAHGDFTWYLYDGKISTIGAYYNGKRNGKWSHYNDEGILEREEEYYYGDKHGQWKYYYPDGKIKRTENYDYDQLQGETVYYFQNGKTEMNKKYLDNSETDTAYYYDVSGELKHIRIYHFGHVISYSYLGADGKLVPPLNIENGSYKFLSYYKNGKKSKEYECKNGYYQGKFTEYYPDGTVQEESWYRDNLNNGTETVYFPSGKMEHQKNYSENMLDGPFTEYYPDGKIKKQLNYKMDHLHGQASYFDRTGKKIKEETYISGKVVKSLTF